MAAQGPVAPLLEFGIQEFGALADLGGSDGGTAQRRTIVSFSKHVLRTLLTCVNHLLVSSHISVCGSAPGKIEAHGVALEVLQQILLLKQH
jgi:hypothetical protein